jgi:copper chaperone CopZ
MTCDHCVRAVTEAAQGVAGVSGVRVDLASNSATVEADGADVGAIIAAIKEEGYEASVRSEVGGRKSEA